MSQKSPVVEFADRNIEDIKTKAVFLSCMSAFLIGNNFRKRLKDLEVNQVHPVWPFLEEYMKEKYHIILSEYVAAPQRDEEA